MWCNKFNLDTNVFWHMSHWKPDGLFLKWTLFTWPTNESLNAKALSHIMQIISLTFWWSAFMCLDRLTTYGVIKGHWSQENFFIPRCITLKCLYICSTPFVLKSHSRHAIFFSGSIWCLVSICLCKWLPYWKACWHIGHLLFLTLMPSCFLFPCLL